MVCACGKEVHTGSVCDFTVVCVNYKNPHKVSSFKFPVYVKKKIKQVHVPQKVVYLQAKRILESKTQKSIDIGFS